MVIIHVMLKCDLYLTAIIAYFVIILQVGERGHVSSKTATETIPSSLVLGSCAQVVIQAIFVMTLYDANNAVYGPHTLDNVIDYNSAVLRKFQNPSDMHLVDDSKNA